MLPNTILWLKWELNSNIFTVSQIRKTAREIELVMTASFHCNVLTQDFMLYFDRTINRSTENKLKINNFDRNIYRKYLFTMTSPGEMS